MKRRGLAIEIIVLLGLAALTLYLRWPAATTPGFQNQDVAGITYNADLLRHGMLPYHDFFELKSPGAYFGTHLLWGVFDRSLLVMQRFMIFWSFLGSLGVFFCGRLLYGRAAGLVAATLHVLLAPIVDSIDVNYGAWMVAPYVWSMALLFLAAKTGRLRWVLTCGVVLALAGLFKRQAAVLFPVIAGGLLLAPRLALPEGWTPPHWKRSLPALFGGLALGFGTLMLVYLFSGGFAALGDLVSHYFFSQSGWRYAGGELPWEEKWPRVGDGFLGLWEYLATAALGAVVTLVAARGPDGRLTWRGAVLGAFFWMSWLGAAIGFRFFKGYYMQVLPAAAIIAAHPLGALTRWFRGGAWARGARLGSATQLLCVMLAFTPALLGDFKHLKNTRDRRARQVDQDTERVGRLIRENTEPDDRIWVWGRWAWPVYYHSERFSATHYYKVLGVITNNLTNTWRRRTEQTRFIDRGPWRELIDELEADPPPYLVLSRNELYDDFAAFKKLLKEQYRREGRYRSRQFVLYRHKDHPPTKYPPRKKRPPKPAKKK